jgi:hypothetical protein
MASPENQGTLVANAFTSADIDVLYEAIHIKPDANFEFAHFQIEYQILSSDTAGLVPLLFYAINCEGEFKVWLDGQPVNLKEVGEHYQESVADLSHFEEFFIWDEYSGTRLVAEMSYDENSSFQIDFDDLLFFDLDLSKGEHTVRVEYDASVWLYRGNWVREYSLRYALSPAKFWKSFGSLSISLDTTLLAFPITTNLGPATSEIAGLQVWNFQELPADVLLVERKPEITEMAQASIDLGPQAIAWILTLLTCLPVVLLMRRYRKKKPTPTWSWYVLGGAALLPFAMVFYRVISYDIIDWLIGQEASSFHGYTFMLIFIYPVLVACYFAALFAIDYAMKWHFKRKLQPN